MMDRFVNVLKDVDINTPGSRHSSLLAIMSAGASRVMPEDELKAVVAQGVHLSQVHQPKNSTDSSVGAAETAAPPKDAH